MNKIQEIKDIFSMFHDGYIESIEAQEVNIELKIAIQYLAMLLHKNHEYLFLTLKDVKHFEFETWTDQPKKIINCEKIAELSPEIMDAKLNEKGQIRVTTLTHRNTKNTITGGFLNILCTDYELLDEQKNQITINKLKELTSYYWELKIKE